MKREIALVLLLIFLTSLVFADVVSINSGGGANLIVNPGANIEGFFFSSAFAPNNPTNVTLVSVDGTNQSNSNLNCSAYVSDRYKTQLTNYVNWIKNNVSTLNQTLYNQSNGTTVSSVLGSGNLTLGDVWQCGVRSYDRSKYSNWVYSNYLKIIDITPPNVTIISPQAINYTYLNVSFNVTATDNEAVSSCLYNLDFASNNVTMNETNATSYYAYPSLSPGTHYLTYYCNDTSGNWGKNSTNFTILNSAAISVALSDNLSNGVKWNVVSLPVHNLDAEGNNGTGITTYFINVSATNTLVDLYVKASGDLTDAALDTLGLGNETYSVSTNDSTVTGISKVPMSTNYTIIGSGLGTSALYMKFYLDAPSSQPAGTYTNNLSFEAVRHGQSP